MADNSNLPDTYNIQWRGIKPQVHSSHPWVPVGDAYITVGYDPVKNVIMSNLQMKDTDNYKGKITIKINGKDYDITNKAYKINCNKDLEVTFYFTYFRPGYSHTDKIYTFKIKSNNKPVALDKIELLEYWGYVLEGFGVKPWVKLPKDYDKYYDISKSKQMPIYEPYDVDLPAKLTYDQRKAIKEVFGYDMVFVNENPNDPISKYWVGLWPKINDNIHKQKSEHSNNQNNQNKQIKPIIQYKPERLKMIVKLVKKPLIRGVIVSISGKGVNYSKKLNKVGEEIVVDVYPNEEYTVVAKKEFGIIKLADTFIAKDGINLDLKGLFVDLHISIGGYNVK